MFIYTNTFMKTLTQLFDLLDLQVCIIKLILIMQSIFQHSWQLVVSI